jgi:hypothetical protein
MRYWLKESPRCRGDLREESDEYGPFLSCVQCGCIATDAQRPQLTTLVERFLNGPHRLMRRKPTGMPDRSDA